VAALGRPRRYFVFLGSLIKVCLSIGMAIADDTATACMTGKRAGATNRLKSRNDAATVEER